MLVLGDVFAVVAVLLGITLTTVALLLAQGLLAPQVALRSSERLKESPMARFALGTVVGLPVLFILVILANLPSPLIRTLGVLGMFAWVLFSTAGLTGVVKAMADRMRSMDPNMGEFAAMQRASLLLVGALLVPFVGWILLAPVALLLGFGLSLTPIRSRARSGQFE